MPYTPPSRSPAASQYLSPVHSPGARPNLPRSNSSTSYLQRHRRSPSVPNVQLDQHLRPSYHDTSSVRQSPPPMTDQNMPAGAILSPPDSQNNSSDEDSPHEPKANLHELHEAVRRSFDANNTTSAPSENSDRLHINTSTTNSEDVTPLGHSLYSRLSPSARKIAHSRSATESSFFDVSHNLTSSSGQSDESDQDLTDESQKPPLLRKKSGELVKPAIRPKARRKHSSMPGTPTFSKAVHFNEDIEQVRHFLQVDRPIAVSAGASPVEGMEDETEFPFGFKQQNVDWELRLKNFPRESMERMSRPVRVEKLYLSPDQRSLIGVVAVANLAFHKHVVARFTLDYWKTTSEVQAEYCNDLRKARDDGYDQFQFSVLLSDQANLESRTLLLCVKYGVNGTEYWDNNDHTNFQVDFAKKETAEVQKTDTVAPRAIPRSRHTSSAGRPWSMSSLDDDFAHGFDSTPIKFKKPVTNGDSQQKPTPGGAQFSTRYDFGASLSAALSHAQQQLGDRSGIKRTPSSSNTSTIAPRTGLQASSTSEAQTPRPDTILASRQSLDSRAYQEFVSKYCFFGSNKPTSGPTGNDVSGGDGSDDHTPSPQSETSSRSHDVSPMHMDLRQLAPMSYGYFSSERSGLLTPDYHTATAIRG